MKHARKALSLKYLRECFQLDSLSPSGLTWKVRPPSHFKANCKNWNTRYANKFAGAYRKNQNGKEYYVVGIMDNTYLSHRIVYSLFHNVELAVDIQVDHFDGNGLNNRPRNLRLATHNENSHNVALINRNTSGHKGVCWSKDKKMWYGRVTFDRKCYRTGYSHSKDVIISLVQDLRNQLHKQFANHG